MAAPLIDKRISFLNLLGAGKAIPLTGYYVYAILENNIVCYIGKGKKYRVLSHFRGSTNVLLSTKIKENANIYNWIILQEFDDEHESLEYEYELIKHCKQMNHRLYNQMFYSAGRRNNDFFRGVLCIFKQYEKMIFPKEFTPDTTLEDLVEILFEQIDIVCSKMDSDKIPFYKSKPFNKLNFILSPENGKFRVTVL